LAATEKAKVWTSVRKRYFAVEITIPEKRGWGCRRGRAGAAFAALGAGAVI
jgi:hypothetical protein